MKINDLNPTLIFISIILFFIFFGNIATHPASDNDASRLAGILSIVQNNLLSIDNTPYSRVGDRVVYENISYSSKPPILHVLTGLTIKSAFMIKPVLANNYVAIYKTATLITNTIPLVLIYILFYYLARNQLHLRTLASHVWALFLIFGTLIITYSEYLTNHIVESFLQLALFFVLAGYKPTKLNFTLIGVLLSALFAIDITNGVIVGPATILWLMYFKRISINNLVWIILGALPLLFTHFYLSYIQFENFLPPQLFPDTYLSYEGSKWVGNVQGFEALNHPLYVKFFNYTFGTHGLFLYQPLLLVPFFIKQNWRDRLWLYTFCVVFGYILFNTVMQKNYAGSAFGPRRFLPLIPLLYFFVIKNLYDYWGRFSEVKRFLVILSLFVTIIVSYIGYQNPWNNYDVDINSRKVYFPILYTLKNNN